MQGTVVRATVEKMRTIGKSRIPVVFHLVFRNRTVDFEFEWMRHALHR
jgi:hypothetical protein